MAVGSSIVNGQQVNVLFPVAYPAPGAAFRDLQVINARRPLRYVVRGDSITQGSDAGSLNRINAGAPGYWQLAFSNRLQHAVGLDPTLLDVSGGYGFGGLTAAGLNGTFASANDPYRDRADIIFDWLGHNDIASWGAGGATSLQRETLWANFLGRAARAAASGSVLVPVTLIRTTNMSRDETRRYNDRLLNWANERGIVPLDMFRVFDGRESNPAWMPDGVHPSPLGYVRSAEEAGRWAKTFFPVDHVAVFVANDQSPSTGLIGRVAPGGYGTYGYNSPPGTFTAQTISRDIAGTANDVRQIVKTGGGDLALCEVPGHTSGFSAGDWIAVAFQYRITQAFGPGTETSLQSAFQAGHSGGYSILKGAINNTDGWHNFMHAYKVAAGATQVVTNMYARATYNSNTNSTGTFEFSGLQVVNLTASNMAAAYDR